MAAPTSPYVFARYLSDDGSGSLILTTTFAGVYADGNPYTSARVQNTSAQTCHVVVTTPRGHIAQGTVAAGFDHTFAQAVLGGWLEGDSSEVENVSWS